MLGRLPCRLTTINVALESRTTPKLEVRDIAWKHLHNFNFILFAINVKVIPADKPRQQTIVF